MMQKTVTLVLGIVAAVLVLASQSLFIVDQREQAIVLQLGQPVGKAGDPESFINGPGLHVKIPFVQNVQYFDRRILAVDPPAAQVVISSSSFARPAPKTEMPLKEGDKSAVPAATGEAPALQDGPVIENVSGEPIIVDTFARYRIVDPLQFLKTLRTIGGANMRLETILNDATRSVLGQTTLKELLSAGRQEVMNKIRESVNRKITQDQLGIEIVDVRIVRADLTAELRTSTVRRMISELKERATETRAKGEERALEIRSTAEKERAVLLANAERDAQVLRGKGDNEAISVYAAAYNQDPDLYAFMRSMEAYKNTLANPDTRLILSPDSDFFRYFGKGSGGR